MALPVVFIGVWILGAVLWSAALRRDDPFRLAKGVVLGLASALLVTLVLAVAGFTGTGD